MTQPPRDGATIPTAQLAAYSALSLPLAMAALPVYVHVPKLYASLGLSLAWLGLAMLILRTADAVVDPWLGRVSDRVASRKRMIALACLPLSVGVFITFVILGPTSDSTALQIRLLFGLALTYLGFSAITIAYHAWGGEWSDDTHERTRITTWREGAGLIGVLIASALPVVLAQSMGVTMGYALFAFALIAVLVVCALVTLYFAPARATAQAGAAVPLSTVLGDGAFRRLLIAFALNGIAAAIPATLFLFFADDVVRAADWQAQFLIAYFISGALATPIWLAVSKRIGKRRAWGASMAVAVLTFVWAYFLGPGDRFGFLAVCVLSGLALGADLTLPPSMLADIIARRTALGENAAGAFFGVWTMVTKLNLALAAGIALPALALLGYVPGASAATAGAQVSTHALSLAYALIPCVLKLVALAALFFVKDDSV